MNTEHDEDINILSDFEVTIRRHHKKYTRGLGWKFNAIRWAISETLERKGIYFYDILKTRISYPEKSENRNKGLRKSPFLFVH